MGYRVKWPEDKGKKIEVGKRPSLSKKKRQQVWDNAKNEDGIVHCYYCKEPIKENETWHGAHIEGKNYALTGSMNIEDIRPSHASCNIKHYIEHEKAGIWKAKRLAGETGKRPKKKINSQGFQGHRKFNGDIVKKDA